MLKTVMTGTWIYKMGISKLFNSAKPLKNRCIYQSYLILSEADIAIDWVSKNFIIITHIPGISALRV